MSEKKKAQGKGNIDNKITLLMQNTATAVNSKIATVILL